MTKGLGTLMLIFCSAANAADPDPAPPEKGLVVWLDASDENHFVLGPDNRVLIWRDRSRAEKHAETISPVGPVRILRGINGRPAVRFSGKEHLKVPKLAESPGNLTVFVVFQRHKEQAGPRKWQRLLSCWDGNSKGDNKPPSFQFCTKEGSEVPAGIRYDLLSHRHRGEMWIGANMTGGHQQLQGDIAEILVYDFGFLVDEQIQNVREYLRGKWDIPEDPDAAWTRRGVLPDAPVRANHKTPLSDQDNQGRWTPLPELWDEFEDNGLDTEKWWDHNPRWYGRAPARYLGEGQNVTISDGMMHITMKRDDSLPEEQFYKNGDDYKSYSSGSIVSKKPVRYGYFEIRARCMDSAGSSAFWFSSRMKHIETGQTYRSEIDVFEIGGAAPGHERVFHMNAHIFETPQDGKKHWSRGGTWEAPFRFADDVHVFGLEWDPAFIQYYVDGVPVRKMKNTHWHSPMFMIFDSETMGSWLGMPNDKDLPSTFSVDYVRAWKNPDTEKPWQKEFEVVGNPDETTGPTKYVRSMDQYGKN